ncbi:hypothetical protein ACIP5Y_00810 [Nocardia sp. NPDC088792]|uniref:hypothetical protein n=1 Tax=Nocardia sp. NPDC088792 TaxID=3364332 RepID=UPI0038032258
MACMESRAGTSDGRGDITFHWHETVTEVFLTMSAAGPCIEVAWKPTAESGVRVYLALEEATDLADALTAALIAHNRFSAENDGEDSGPDWGPSPSPEDLPPVFGPAVWPQEREF